MVSLPEFQLFCEPTIPLKNFHLVCEPTVVSPEGVRDRIKQKLIDLCRHYDLEIRD